MISDSDRKDFAQNNGKEEFPCFLVDGEATDSVISSKAFLTDYVLTFSEAFSGMLSPEGFWIPFCQCKKTKLWLPPIFDLIDQVKLQNAADSNKDDGLSCLKRRCIAHIASTITLAGATVITDAQTDVLASAPSLILTSEVGGVQDLPTSRVRGAVATAQAVDGQKILSAYGYAETGQGYHWNNYKIARAMLVNGKIIQVKTREQRYPTTLPSTPSGRAECDSVVKAMEEVLLFREELRLQGFPQSGPTELQVSLSSIFILTSLLDHGVRIAELHRLLQGQIDL